MIIIFTGSIFSQTTQDPAEKELEALERLAKFVEEGRASEAEAKKTILNVFYDTKADVRKQYSKLTSEEIEQMGIAQKVMWDSTVMEALSHYENVPYGYERFLRNQYEVLVGYNDAIMDLLYYGIHNDIMNEFATRVVESVLKINSSWGEF